MEMKCAWGSLVNRMWRTACCTAIFMLVLADPSMAQLPTFNIKGGKIQVVLPKTIKESDLDLFISRFDLKDLALKKLLREGFADSIHANGWEIAQVTNAAIILSKVLASSDLVNDPAGRIIFTGEQPWRVDLVFPVVSNTVVLGYNRFRNKPSFAIRDSTVYFHLRGHEQARVVKLAGSFNDWDPEALDMQKTDSGWYAGVRLKPGKYWYKFIIDGEWTADGDNRLSESDGIGNTNSVYFYTNTVFRLRGHTSSKRVYVSGGFNNWNPKELAMERTADGWELPVYLKDGTHTYRFVVDGRWMADPANPDKLPNEYNEFNSVIAIGKPHLFRLPGYQDAKQVLLTGSFNGWRKNELYLRKTPSGWELPYVLGAGNHEYGFIIDGKQIADPNSLTVTGNHNTSYLIIQPNYTFRLKGFPQAKSVFLSGEFNFWSPNSLAMKRENEEWVLSVHLSPGKHLYKFIVDGNWILDPANKLWEQNEHNTGNSVLWMDR